MPSQYWVGYWDHLRVCGADGNGTGHIRLEQGSPPRVRSRPQSSTLLRIFGGDHLRVCGADPGLPATPLTRSWITSACAEQTRQPCDLEPEGRDHLRVCGADLNPLQSITFHRGSPPRVRSRHSLMPDPRGGG